MNSLPHKGRPFVLRRITSEEKRVDHGASDSSNLVQEMTRKKAIGEFDGLNICGRALLVSEARPQESRGGHNRFGGGRGRNRGGGRRGYQLRKCPWLVALKVGRGNGFFRAKACKV